LGQTFAQLNRIGSNIRSRKREIKALHKDWLALKAKVEPVMNDPAEDSE